MRRYSVIIIILLLVVGLKSSLAQDPWQQVIPRMSFGYGGLLSVYWSPINGQLAAASESGFQFYNENMQLEGERRFDDISSSVPLFSPDMRYVATQEFDGLIIRDTTTWQPILALGDYNAPSWSPDSQKLAIWASTGLQIWDVATATVKLEAPELISNGQAVQWTPDSAVVAAAGPGAIIMLRTDTGEIVRIHPFAKIISFDMSADGKYFAVIGYKDPLPVDRKLDDPNDPILNDLMRVDALTGEVITRYDLRSGGIADSRYGARDFVKISPNGRYVAARLSRWQPFEDRSLERWTSAGMGVWNFESGDRMHDFSDYSRPLYDVTYLSWSPSGDYFATSLGNALQVYDAVEGTVFSSLQAYIVSTEQTEWSGQAQLVAAGGLWNVGGQIPEYVGQQRIDSQPPDFFQPSEIHCTNNALTNCPPVMIPDRTVFDYNMPPYDFELLHYIPERGYIISYEREIEYIGTPEYEDGEPPWERFVLWDSETGERMERHINLSGQQTAWIYDLENVNYVESESRAFNVLRNTYYVAIGDDEILNLRTGEKIPLEGVQRWEWREVFFRPDGAQVISYDTDRRFKFFDPFTGKMLFETEPAPREGLFYNNDYRYAYVVDSEEIVHIYDTASGTKILELYTGNYQKEFRWSPDHSLLAVGGDNRAIIIYDVASQTRLGILRGHRATVTSMDWNPDCDLTNIEDCDYILASSDQNGQVILWGSASRGGQTALNIPVSPAAATLNLPETAINYRDLEALWNYVAEADHIGRDTAHRVEWSESGILVNGAWYYDNMLHWLEDPSDWQGERSLTVSNGNGRLVTEGGLLLRTGGSSVGSLGYGAVYDATFSPDGTRVLTAENDGGQGTISGYIREWSAESGQPIQYWGGGNPGFNQLELSPDGRWYATATIDYYSAGGRGQIWFADRFNTQYSSLIGHTDTINQLYWYGGNVITSSLDGSVRLWDIHTGLQLARWREDSRAPVVKMEWMPDEKSLLVSAGTSLYILNAATLEVVREFEGVGGGDFDWSPDHTQIVAIGNDIVVRIIDLASGRVVAQERRHMPPIADLQWHPGGELLAVARHNGSLILLNGQTGTVTRTLRPYGNEIQAMAWSPDGTKLALDLLDGGIEILNGQTGAVITTIQNDWRRKGLWWSPDSVNVLFATYPDPDMGVYTATSLLYRFNAETGAEMYHVALDWQDYIWYWEVKPFRVEFSADGSQFAAFYGKNLRVWDFASGSLIAAHEKIERNISLVHWQGAALNFWTPNGQWQFNPTTATLTQTSLTGLPLNTFLRDDEKVILANEQIMDFATFYPLQAIPANFSSADWHPSCWSQECPAVLAVASGYEVTLYGYGNEE